jgi:hypothetical protein
MTTNTLRNTLGFALGLRAYSCRPDVKDIYNTSNGVYDPAFGWVDKLVVY